MVDFFEMELPRTKKPNTFEKVDSTQNVSDPRHPLYLGEWERSIPKVHRDFAQDDLDEPHLKRKREILARHPQISRLYGPEHTTKYILFAAIAFQLCTAYYVGEHTSSLFVLIVTAYFVGGFVTSLMGVLIHECAHNLMAPSPLANRLYALLSNVIVVMPIAASFRRYHLKHHTYQGIVGVDPDLPLAIEWKLIRNGRVLKALWVLIFPFLYVLRGAAMLKTPSKWEIINWVFTAVCDTLLYQTSSRGFLYLFFSLWFGYGLHPGAAHFIQEHYTFVDGQETYSYYGVLNYPLLNIGLHNEHHDFTRISWRYLPQVKKIAAEFYDMHCHTSWVRVIYDFIMRDDIGPQSRLGRNLKDHQNGRSLIK